MHDRPQRTDWVRVLALFTAASFVEAQFVGHLMAFTPLHLPLLGVAPEQVALYTGLITAVGGLAGLPFLPFWGALADRYARKPLIVRSFVAHLLAGAIALAAGSLWVFVLARAVMSLSMGNSGLMMTTLAERAPRDRIGFALAVMNGAAPLGVFLGPLTGGPLVDRWGLPALLAIDVALMALVIGATALGYRDSYRGTGRDSLLRMAGQSLRLVWATPRVPTLFAALFLLFAGLMMAMTYVPLAVTALYSGSEPGTAVGVVMGAGGLITLFLSPVLGALADRRGHWRVLLAVAGAQTLLWPLPALAPDLVSFGVAWSVLNGLASAGFAISFTVLAESAPAAARGRIMSFAYLPVILGSMAGGAAGSAVTRLGVFAVFPVAAVMTALGIVALRAAWRQRAGLEV